MNCKGCGTWIPDLLCRCGHQIDQCDECAHREFVKAKDAMVARMARNLADRVDEEIVRMAKEAR